MQTMGQEGHVGGGKVHVPPPASQNTSCHHCLSPGEVTFPPSEVPSERQRPQAGKGAGSRRPRRLGLAAVFWGGPAPAGPVPTPGVPADSTRRTRAPAHPPARLPSPGAPGEWARVRADARGQPPVADTLGSPQHRRRGRTEEVTAGRRPTRHGHTHVTEWPVRWAPVAAS